MNLVILPIVPYLGALLGLLLIWRHHDMQIAAGNRLALGLFNRSGMRMYLFAAPDMGQICPACREIHGTVFHPRLAEAPSFSPLASPCKSPDVCASVLIGFYGGWLEAADAVKRLAAPKSEGRVKLTPQELSKLARGWCASSPGAAVDRVGVEMLTALLAERATPIHAVTAYGHVVDKAKETRELSLLVPAYLRLTSLLAQRGDPKRAIQVIEHFEKRYYRCEPGPHYPTARQRRAMAVMKPYLMSMSDPSNKEVMKPTAASSWQ